MSPTITDATPPEGPAPAAADGTTRPAAGASGFDRDLRLAFVALFLFAIGYGLYGQLIGAYALDLGAPPAMLGVLAAVMWGMTAASFIPGSWAADHYPLRIVIPAFWWLTAVSGACFALAPTWQWLVVGFAVSGLSMGSNPTLKVFIMLRSPATLAARNIAYVYAGLPLGLVVGPLAGGVLAHRYGMRTVFWIATGFFVASSTAVSCLRHTPYNAAGKPWRLQDLTGNRLFRRHVTFFFCGFLAVYLAQQFVLPYLKEVHHYGYVALGVFASLGALGGTVVTFLAGRLKHRRGSRVAIATVLAFMLLGAGLLLGGMTAVVLAAGVFCFGAFDAFRFVTSGVVSRSFGDVPPTWGFSIFDATMGVPMTVAPLLGGLLAEVSYRLPFVAFAVLAVALLAVLAFAERGREWRDSDAHDAAAGGEG